MCDRLCGKKGSWITTQKVNNEQRTIYQKKNLQEERAGMKDANVNQCL